MDKFTKSSQSYESGLHWSIEKRIYVLSTKWYYLIYSYRYSQKLDNIKFYYPKDQNELPIPINNYDYTIISKTFNWLEKNCIGKVSIYTSVDSGEDPFSGGGYLSNTFIINFTHKCDYVAYTLWR